MGERPGRPSVISSVLCKGLTGQDEAPGPLPWERSPAGRGTRAPWVFPFSFRLGPALERGGH